MLTKVKVGNLDKSYAPSSWACFYFLKAEVFLAVVGKEWQEVFMCDLPAAVTQISYQ